MEHHRLRLGPRLSRRTLDVVGAGGVVLAAFIGLGLLFVPLPLEVALWTWFDVGGLRPEVTLRLDPLARVMVLVVTVVGALIHVYATAYMADDPNPGRFFALTNLFVASMLLLVLARDLLVLYVGWELVGLCSYRLIGFWSAEPANDSAAQKAFLVTRAGDAAMAIGLFLLIAHLGTLDIPAVVAGAEATWAAGEAVPVTACALLLAGAAGKSAQVPLHLWLPDAMAGPTPVSALIHAATMVTAGVYLLARLDGLFALAPVVQATVAILGALTLLLAGMSALVENDIKRVLAWSTISQLGYLFVALGVGAVGAAMFHLVSHAAFKALLFLGAGVVIHRLVGEHDLRRMGGLRGPLPWTFVTFAIGAAALAGLPLTAGFASKDAILHAAWAEAGIGLFAAGTLGAFLTGAYTGRLVFRTFFGRRHPLPDEGRAPGATMLVPMGALALLSLGLALWDVPAAVTGATHEAAPMWIPFTVTTAAMLGLAVAWVVARRGATLDLDARPRPVDQLWAAGWGADRLVDLALVRPYRTMTWAARGDVISWLPRGLVWLARRGHDLLARAQSGRLRWYATGLATGAALVLALAVL